MTGNVNQVVSIGEERDREMLKGAAAHIYADRPQGEIKAHLFLPKKPSGKPRMLVVFFLGGFWESPSPAQFVPHCLHFSDRGAVAVAANDIFFMARPTASRPSPKSPHFAARPAGAEIRANSSITKKPSMGFSTSI
jgi:hypothetical protein